MARYRRFETKGTFPCILLARDHFYWSESATERGILQLFMSIALNISPVVTHEVYILYMCVKPYRLLSVLVWPTKCIEHSLRDCKLCCAAPLKSPLTFHKLVYLNCTCTHSTEKSPQLSGDPVYAAHVQTHTEYSRCRAPCE